MDRALEHDPSVLLHQALGPARVVRPEVDRLMRATGAARVTADDEIHLRLSVRSPSLVSCGSRAPSMT